MCLSGGSVQQQQQQQRRLQNDVLQMLMRA
jgi:hypothetical protein